jgi:hypothetical protein
MLSDISCSKSQRNLITLNNTHTVNRSPLDEGSARRRGLYLTKHNTHKRQASILPEGIEPMIPANKWLQTLTLDRASV